MAHERSLLVNNKQFYYKLEILLIEVWRYFYVNPSMKHRCLQINSFMALERLLSMDLSKPKTCLAGQIYRRTHYEQIEKWWEMVMSAFLMVSLFADAFNKSCPTAHQQLAEASLVEQSKRLETSAQ